MIYLVDSKRFPISAYGASLHFKSGRRASRFFFYRPLGIVVSCINRSCRSFSTFCANSRFNTVDRTRRRLRFTPFAFVSRGVKSFFRLRIANRTNLFCLTRFRASRRVKSYPFASMRKLLCNPFLFISANSANTRFGSFRRTSCLFVGSPFSV